MAFELRFCFLVSIISIVAKLTPSIQAAPQVPCCFIFGDSLFDNGNNNDLPTTAKVNYPPYGIDFPDGPTGRFSNGRNMADFVAQLLGFDKFIPPFAIARAPDILTGVNYASGGAGIRDETGLQLGARISLSRQLLHHRTKVFHIAFLLGSKEAAANYLSKCLYLVGMGSNDYINNYLMPQYYPTSRLYTPEKYSAVLIQEYSRQLRALYKLGARKVAIFGLGPIGCSPAEISNYHTGGCVETINNNVQLFNNGLKFLVDELNYFLVDAKFIYINITHISSVNPGATFLNSPCCIVSESNFGEGQCQPNQVPCVDRSIYAFWDAFHPTEISSLFLTTRAYSAKTPFDAYPVDIRRLAQL